MTRNLKVSNLSELKNMIDSLEPEAQKRVNSVAHILRDLMRADNPTGEVELAFTLVLAELAE